MSLIYKELSIIGNIANFLCVRHIGPLLLGACVVDVTVEDDDNEILSMQNNISFSDYCRGEAESITMIDESEY